MTGGCLLRAVFTVCMVNKGPSTTIIIFTSVQTICWGEGLMILMHALLM